MNCCNHNKMPRPVRGNAFNVAVTVIARRIDGTVIDDFALTSEAVLNITHGTSSTEKEYTIIDQNVAVIHFDGTDAAGIYGVEFTGEWNGEPWRFAVPVVFQVVELTTQGWLPQDGIIYEPTYEVDAEIVIAGGGGGGDVQADWTETDPDSPAYIQHKPTIYTQAETDALLAGKLNGYEIIECNITAVDGSDKATVDNNNWHTEAIAAYEAKKIPVLYGQAISSGTIYSMMLTVEKYTAGGDDYRIYGSAAITIGGSSPRRNILYAEMQSTHSNASLYISDFVDKLVSGRNIKTVNGNSLLGSGNVTIPTGLTTAYEVVDAGLLYLDQTNTYYEVPATVYTALKAVWDAGKVPVLAGSLNSHTTGFALIPTYLNNSFYCFYHAASTMSGNRWHLSGTISSTGGQLYPEEEQKPITVDQTVQAGSTNPVSGAGVKTYVDNALAGTPQQVHTNEVAATLDSEKVHIFTGTTDTLAITLTAPTDALSHLFTMILTTGTTPAVTIQVSDSTAIIYPDDYAIEAGTTYEISVLYANGKYYLRYVTYQEA